MVEIGKRYKVVLKSNGSTTTGTLKKVARLRNGCVLGFMDNGKSFPISKYADWKAI